MKHLLSKTPPEHRSNFLNLYFDIAWFGVLTGSTIAFLSVYLVRIGASVFQVGLLSASPAVITMLFALPAGWWLKKRTIDKAVFWTSVFYRLFYAFFIPLPVLFGPQLQTWAIIFFTLMMSIPGTALAVGFNAMVAQAVPLAWRSSVAGVRNAILAVTSTMASLLCGLLLEKFPFPAGYQLVFALGFLGAAMSSLHLGKVRIVAQEMPVRRHRKSLGYLFHPGLFRSAGDVLRSAGGLRFLRGIQRPLKLKISLLKGPFGMTMFALFLFHLMQYLAIPLYPIYYVDALGLSDQEISLGNSLFYGILFISSTQVSRLTNFLGLHKATVLGALLISVYPFMLALSRGFGMFMVTMVVAGIFSGLIGVALGNYLLEIIPEDDRPMYLAWYTLILNTAIFIGSLSGPLIAEKIGLITVMFVVAAGRAAAAFGIWIFGERQLISIR